MYTNLSHINDDIARMHDFHQAQHAEGVLRHLIQVKMCLKARKPWATFLPNSGDTSDYALGREVGLSAYGVAQLLKREV